MKPFIGVLDKYGYPMLVSILAISDVRKSDEGFAWITTTNGELIETRESFDNIEKIWLKAFN